MHDIIAGNFPATHIDHHSRRDINSTNRFPAAPCRFADGTPFDVLGIDDIHQRIDNGFRSLRAIDHQFLVAPPQPGGDENIGQIADMVEMVMGDENRTDHCRVFASLYQPDADAASRIEQQPFIIIADEGGRAEPFAIDPRSAGSQKADRNFRVSIGGRAGRHVIRCRHGEFPYSDVL